MPEVLAMFDRCVCSDEKGEEGEKACARAVVAVRGVAQCRKYPSVDRGR